MKLHWIPLLLIASGASAQTFTDHRTNLGRIQEGQTFRVTAVFFDSSDPPVKIIVDQVQCWVRNKGEDPTVVAPLYSCPTIAAPGVTDVPIDLPPLASRIFGPNSTATERHTITVLGQTGAIFIPLEGEFDVINDPGIVVDPGTGIPGPVIPPTATPTP